MFSMVKFALNFNKAAVISQHGVKSVPHSLSKAMKKNQQQNKKTIQCQPVKKTNAQFHVSSDPKNTSTI